MISFYFSLLSSLRRFFTKSSVDESSLAAEQLEPRILYSAAPVDAPAPEAVEEAPVQEALAPAQEATPAAVAPIAVAAVDPETPVESGEGDVAEEQGVTLVDVDDAAASLNQETVETLAAEARQRWIDSGISADQIAALDSVSYDVADVGGAHLGVANGSSITIDDDAGGTGVGNWFIDATPDDDSEFAGGASAASGRFDLLSTLIHEQGHVLGLGDLYGQRTDVMDGFLDEGTRRMPTVGQADDAVVGSVSGANYLTANILRASTDLNGVEANAPSSIPSISGNGRYVVFQTRASNLVAGDTNGANDTFVKDTATGQLTRVNTDSNGQQAIGSDPVNSASISNDGRYVLFDSGASNLVAGDTNGTVDLFLKDLETGELTRVSTDSTGAQSNGASVRGTISANNRYVVFESSATNLVSGDTNAEIDVFIKDLKTGEVKRVSTSTTDQEGSEASLNAQISADGHFVAFESYASDLVFGDTNGQRDIFVKNLRTGKLIRVSTDSDGAEVTGEPSTGPSISANGRYVAFNSVAGGLVSDDTNGGSDVFVKDTKTGITTRVSTNASGGQVIASSLSSSISADGRFVAFSSTSPSLVVGDTNNQTDIFIKDRATGAITLVSTNASGGQGDGDSSSPYRTAISADGRFVAFESESTNLVSGDSNGERDVFVKGISEVTSDTPYTTSVEIDSLGNLVIEDFDGDTDDKLFIGIVDGRLKISDAKATVGSSIVGSTLVGTKGRGVSVDLSSFTGDIVVRTEEGKDRVTFGDLHDLPGGVESYDEYFDEDKEERIEVRGDISVAGSSDINLGAQQIVLHKGSSLTTESGQIDLSGNDQLLRSKQTGISSNGATLTSGSGSIDLEAYGGEVGGGNRGVFLKNTDIISASGDVNISGYPGAPGSGNTGVHLGRGTDIMLGGTGTLYISGSVGDGKNGNRGLRIDSGVTLETNDGDIYLSGSVPDAVSSNVGMQIGKAMIRVIGNGDLRVSGSVMRNTGSRDTAISLKGTTIEALGTGDLTVDYMGNTSTEGRGNMGVVMSSARIFSNAGDVDIIKNPIFGSNETFGNTGVRAVKSYIGSEGGDLTIRGFHDKDRTGSGNRGFDFARGTIDVGGAIDIRARGGGGGSGNTALQITSSEIKGFSVYMLADGASTTTGSNNRGIDFNKVTLEATNFVNIIGNAGAGTSNNEGMRIRGGSIQSNSSTVSVVGNANPTTDTSKANNSGLNLSKTSIEAFQKVTIIGRSGTGTNGNSGLKMRNVMVESQGLDVSIRGHANLATDAIGKNNRGIDARNVEVSAPGDVTINGTGGAGTNGNVATSINGGTLTSLGSNVTITGVADSVTTGTGNSGVILKNVDTTALSDATISATGGGGTNKNVAISIGGGSLISQSADVNVTGTARIGTTGSFNHGVEILGSTINAQNSDVAIRGTGGGGINQNMGVRIIGGSILAEDGNSGVSIIGDARVGTLGSWNVGTYIFNKVTTEGSLDVDGAGGGGTKLNHGIFMHRNITADNVTSTIGSAGAGDDSEDEAGDFFAP